MRSVQSGTGGVFTTQNLAKPTSLKYLLSGLLQTEVDNSWSILKMIEKMLIFQIRGIRAVTF